MEKALPHDFFPSNLPGLQSREFGKQKGALLTGTGPHQCATTLTGSPQRVR